MAKLSRELQMGIHNRFDVEVIDIKTGKVIQKAQAFNVVCNSYFSKILSDAEAEYIQIGSGSGTPSASDTALFAYVGYGDATPTYSPYDTIDSSHEYEGVWVRTIKRAIPNTSYVGSTITELGLATSSSGSNIVTHAMLQDMNGNPISIQHTSTDIINIYCSIYLHYSGQNSDVHLFKGWEYWYYNKENKRAIVNRALLKPLIYASNSDNDLYAYGVWGIANPIMCNDSCMSSLTWSNSNGALKIKFTQIPISSGNYQGLGVIGVANERYSSYGTSHGLVFVDIDTGGTIFPPTNITGEVVGTGDGSTTKFRTAFSYPRNAVVKVNGIAQTGVTVKKTPVGVSWSHDTYVSYFRELDAYGGWRHYTIVNNNNVNLRKYRDGYAYHAFYNGDTIRIEHPEIGVYTFYYSSNTDIQLKGSNDGVNWTSFTVPHNNTSTPLSDDYAHFKYYKNDSGINMQQWYMRDYDGYNIIFDNPPAVGDVITIDYTTDYIPKDEDHVLDVELTFTFGEYVGS